MKLHTHLLDQTIANSIHESIFRTSPNCFRHGKQVSMKLSILSAAPLVLYKFTYCACNAKILFMMLRTVLCLPRQQITIQSTNALHYRAKPFFSLHWFRAHANHYRPVQLYVVCAFIDLQFLLLSSCMIISTVLTGASSGPSCAVLTPRTKGENREATTTNPSTPWFPEVVSDRGLSWGNKTCLVSAPDCATTALLCWSTEPTTCWTKAMKALHYCAKPFFSLHWFRAHANQYRPIQLYVVCAFIDLQFLPLSSCMIISTVLTGASSGPSCAVLTPRTKGQNREATTTNPSTPWFPEVVSDRGLSWSNKTCLVSEPDCATTALLCWSTEPTTCWTKAMKALHYRAKPFFSLHWFRAHANQYRPIQLYVVCAFIDLQFLPLSSCMIISTVLTGASSGPSCAVLTPRTKEENREATTTNPSTPWFPEVVSDRGLSWGNKTCLVSEFDCATTALLCWSTEPTSCWTKAMASHAAGGRSGLEAALSCKAEAEPKRWVQQLRIVCKGSSRSKKRPGRAEGKRRRGGRGGGAGGGGGGSQATRKKSNSGRKRATNVWRPKGGGDTTPAGRKPQQTAGHGRGRKRRRHKKLQGAAAKMHAMEPRQARRRRRHNSRRRCAV